MSEPIRLWSVTSLLKLGLGTSDALVNWAVNTTCEAAFDRYNVLSQFVQDGDKAGAVDWLKRQRFQKSGVAAARGTDMHNAAEQLALGLEPKIEPENQGYLDSYLRFLEEHKPEFLMAEAPVYAPSYGYAGTLDAVMRLGESTVVADIKSTPHAPDSGRSRPPFGEAPLQAVAYRRAELVGVLSEQRYSGTGKRYYQFSPDADHSPMPETDGAVCITVSPFDYVITPMRSDDEVWTVFRHVMECARWQVETSRSVFGPPISRKAVAA